MRSPVRLILFIGLVFPAVLCCQEAETHSHEEYRNLVGVFLGGTRLPGEHGFTAGLEYERRLARDFGLGLTAETIKGNINENVFVGLGYFHPVEELAIFAGGGWDRRLKVEEPQGGEGAVSHGHGEELRGRRPLARVGVAYEIPAGHRGVVNPNVSVDFAGGEVIVVFGVTFGLKF